jgi:uncharacterized protein (DUF302 family)
VTRDSPARSRRDAARHKEPSMQNRYGFGRTVPLGFEAALERVTQALTKEGFGVLTEIDVQATLKKKLGHDLPPYRILGACNPAFAHRALASEPSIGLLLPCNVVVRQDDAGDVHVEILDPEALMKLVERSEVNALATEVKARLQRALAAI